MMSDIDFTELSNDELHEVIDIALAVLESRTSKFKRQQKGLLAVMRECSKKIQYQTLRLANKRANKYSEQFNVKCRVYECTQCGLWHITTKETNNG